MLTREQYPHSRRMYHCFEFAIFINDKQDLLIQRIRIESEQICTIEDKKKRKKDHNRAESMTWYLHSALSDILAEWNSFDH